MDWVVSDSSTLIHLSSIGRLNLLKTLYSEIAIPPAVWNEVVIHGADRPGAIEVVAAYKAGWIKLVKPKNKALVQLLSQGLDIGESEAIALAIEKQASFVLIDEADGRKIANLYNLAITGVIGVLFRAKQVGLLNSVETELSKLRQAGNFRIDDALYHKVVKAAGE